MLDDFRNRTDRFPPFAGETVVPVLDPGLGRTKQGCFWAIARDDRPWGGSDRPAMVYSYAPGRGHTHANALLGGYRGILQCSQRSSPTAPRVAAHRSLSDAKQMTSTGSREGLRERLTRLGSRGVTGIISGTSGYDVERDGLAGVSGNSNHVIPNTAR